MTEMTQKHRLQEVANLMVKIYQETEDVRRLIVRKIAQKEELISWS